VTGREKYALPISNPKQVTKKQKNLPGDPFTYFRNGRRKWKPPKNVPLKRHRKKVKKNSIHRYSGDFLTLRENSRIRFRGRVARQRSAKHCTAVRISSEPLRQVALFQKR